MGVSRPANGTLTDRPVQSGGALCPLAAGAVGEPAGVLAVVVLARLVVGTLIIALTLTDLV